MLILLKIVGIVALVAIIVAIFAVRWFWQRMKGAIADAMPVPCRIHPEPEPNPHWRNGSALRHFSEQFRALGFQEIGAFSIPEMGGIQFQAFFHSHEHLYGCAYDHKKLEPAFDVVCLLADETSVTGTNTRLGEAREQRPGRHCVRQEGATVSQIFDAVRQHPSSAGARRPVSAAGFLPYFQKAHADYMNWRLSKGGTSREEIRRQAEQDGHEVTDELIDETYQSMRATYVEQLKEACLAQYLDDSRISAAEWERQESNVLAIPEPLELKEVIESLTDTLLLDDEQRHQLEKVESSFGQTGIDVIAGIMERNVGSLGLKKRGEISAPVRAWILETPEIDYDALDAKS